MNQAGKVVMLSVSDPQQPRVLKVLDPRTGLPAHITSR